MGRLAVAGEPGGGGGTCLRACGLPGGGGTAERVVGVAGAGIAGGLGVGENRTGAKDFAGRVAGFAEELIGNFAFLDPGDERKEEAVHVWRRAGTAEAVIDSWHEGQEPRRRLRY